MKVCKYQFNLFFVFMLTTPILKKLQITVLHLYILYLIY